MKTPEPIFSPTPPKRPGHTDLFGMLVVAGAALFGSAGVATQWMAYRLGFDPNLPGTASTTDPALAQSFGLLGPVLLACAAAGLLAVWWHPVRERLPLRRGLGLTLLLGAGGFGLWAYGLPVRYALYRIVHWAYLFAGDPVLASYVHEGVGVALVHSAAVLLGLFLFAGGARWRASQSFGSARWGDGAWLAAGPRAWRYTRLRRWAGRVGDAVRHYVPFGPVLLPKAKDEGFPIGKKDGRMLYDRSGRHAFICAPTGAGKTVGFSIPALLMHPGSALVVDIKRELYHVTARRRMELGEAAVRLDPFGDQTASYNPMDLIDTEAGQDTLAMDDARMIADMCVIETGKENNPFFIQSAGQLLTGLILGVAYSKERTLTDRATGEVRPNPDRSLPAVRRVLMLANDRLRGYLQSMMGRDLPDAVRGLGAQFADMNEKVFSDVVSTARQHTFFLDSPAMRRCLTETTVSFSALKEGRATVFLVLPDERLGTYYRWLRLMIACAQTEIVRLRKKPEYPILFLLDEFPRLGRFPEIDKGVSLHRSYGIQYALITQTMAQLRDIYGEGAKNFPANAHSRIFWAAADEDAARYISDMAGEMTVAVRNASMSRSRGKGSGHGANISVSGSIQERSRPLVTRSEALTLPSKYCFVFSREQRPLVLERPGYLTDPQFAGLYDPNPEHAPPDAVDAARRRRVEMGLERPAPADLRRTPLGDPDTSERLAASDPSAERKTSSGEGAAPDGTDDAAGGRASPEHEQRGRRAPRPSLDQAQGL